MHPILFDVLLYSVARFVIEFFGGDPRGMIDPRSRSQFVSVALAPPPVVMLRRLSGRRETVSNAAGRRGRRA